MARVLVTGATGLIGRAVADELLRRDHEVIALSRSGIAPKGARGIACDLLAPEGIAAGLRAAGQPEILLHLAWSGGVDRVRSPSNLAWCRATLALAEAFAAAGGRRMVGGGSCAEYDWEQAVLSEATPLRPASAYGAAKAAAGLALTGTGPAVGLSVAWARIFFVFGPGEPRGRLFGDLIRGLAAGERVACTDGTQRRDYLHVADLARGLADLAESELEGPINIARGESIAVRDLVIEVARQIGGLDRVDFGARARPAGDPDLIVADTTRLQRAIGFRPRLDWPEAVAQVLAADPGQ